MVGFHDIVVAPKGRGLGLGRRLVAALIDWGQRQGAPRAYLLVREGNQPAREAVARVFEVADRKWRGIGSIPLSGLRIKESYAAFDAERVFQLTSVCAEEPTECISAEVLLGNKRPTDCAAFGKRCMPEKPLGAPMVSSEGACAAYYHYRRHAVAR